MTGVHPVQRNDVLRALRTYSVTVPWTPHFVNLIQS